MTIKKLNIITVFLLLFPHFLFTGIQVFKVSYKVFCRVSFRTSIFKRRNVASSLKETKSE